MKISDVQAANALVRRRDGLLFLLKAEDYGGVSLTRGGGIVQNIEQWFSDIKETMREAAQSELRAVLEAFHHELQQMDDTAPDEIRTAFDRWLALADPDQRMDVYEAARAYAKHLAEAA